MEVEMLLGSFRKIFGVSSFIIELLLAANHGGAASTDVKEFGRKLDALVPPLLRESVVPGAAVALIQGGEVVFKKGYGYSNLETRKPVTTQTGFNVGSISKTVAAWGVMRLVEEGKLDLDVPVENYLTRWHLPDSDFDKSGVTVRRLLSHTAGLSLHGYPGFGPKDKLPTIEQSLSGATNGAGNVRLIMPPGTRWQYSGGGYTIAQLLVEEVTGQKFADYMREQILRPLGMTRSDYRLTKEILAGSSTAYDDWGDPTPNPRFTAEAAAGLHTTIEDLALFAAAALAGAEDTPPGRGLLQPATITTMLAPAPASEKYGLGYAIESLTGGRIANGHGGANRGWQAFFQIVPETGDGIVITTNGSNGWYVHRQIVCAWTQWAAGAEPTDRCKKPIGIVLISTVLDHGVEAALKQYRELRSDFGEKYDLSENQLNTLGYALLGHDRVKDAIEIFKLNVAAFPESANPYDSLGEAYLADGQKGLAIENYRRSLELNPDNSNAAGMLKKLENP
jgi:CubicO group peptidase (beta-lactamase class C family)